MNLAPLCLSLILLSGCTTTEVVTEYKERVISPPAAYLTICAQPFYAPPKTYGDAVLRDAAWFAAWKSCAEKIEQLRTFLDYPPVTPKTETTKHQPNPS
ncbi:hypothetical protein OTK51_04475 [Vibrio scophthalmi]|uniref:Rz1-like lysis system protein LysC n=1 Tax=Vibrio scophthalmi TaxID=45658 RepID=UPI0022833D26|nr:hypothetical protein [Vibrio scophthalmi]MCY9802683.1 hypothetical protein [Vibrio scophthalmi]